MADGLNEGPDVFVAEFRHWRDVAGLSQTALAARMGYSRTYVSKIESGTEHASRDFAAAADATLKAGGALKRAWHEQRDGRSPTHSHRVTTVAPTPEPSVPGLVVEHDEAELIYDGEARSYRATMRRRIQNTGYEPISRYLIRISVDRHPGDPELSNQLYRDDPLTWEELCLRAWHGEQRERAMNWTPQYDRDAFKEVWLLFEGEDGHFPLYPGESTTIKYTYTVPERKWGPWFRRAVRLPTRRLAVRLDFPSALEPVVWGLHTSMTAQPQPFPTAIERSDRAGRSVFSWSTQDPPLHARYRLEWRFKHEMDRPADRRPSEVMSALGVVQVGDPNLRQTSAGFELPAEAEDARRLVDELHAALHRVAQAHVFGKGMGIAAPQIGIPRRAAVIRTARGDMIVLVNPRAIEFADEQDVQYEGCLSFFDVRGQVPRPLTIKVEHQDLSGARHITAFDRGVARLVQHEIDHLDGMLYTDRMPEGTEPIPVEQYRGTGQDWQYPKASVER